jgi:hypothetical protein
MATTNVPPQLDKRFTGHQTYRLGQLSQRMHRERPRCAKNQFMREARFSSEAGMTPQGATSRFRALDNVKFPNRQFIDL